MWIKKYDYYMGTVSFHIEENGKVRELEFAFNTCFDSLYNSVNDYNNKNKAREIICLLKDEFTRFISCSDSIDESKSIELSIAKSGFDFQLPSEYMKT